MATVMVKLPLEGISLEGPIKYKRTQSIISYTDLASLYLSN